MIWEDEPLLSTVQRLADTGITSVVFDTAANGSEQGDYLDVMQLNAERLDELLVGVELASP